jgi:hypothetical protein
MRNTAWYGMCKEILPRLRRNAYDLMHLVTHAYLVLALGTVLKIECATSPD